MRLACARCETAGLVRGRDIQNSAVMIVLLVAEERDDLGDLTLPARLRNGSTVLNTGGKFLDLTPGISWQLNPSTILQARLFLSVYQNWNGEASTNVGQVAPDITTQFVISRVF